MGISHYPLLGHIPDVSTLKKKKKKVKKVKMLGHMQRYPKSIGYGYRYLSKMEYPCILFLEGITRVFGQQNVSIKQLKGLSLQKNKKPTSGIKIQ